MVDSIGDYCNAKPASNCSGDIDTLHFQCTGVGYFPDLDDCTSYIYCGLSETGDDYEFTVQKCPDGNVYDPNSATFCSRRNIIFNNCIQQTCNVTKITYNQLSYGFNHLFYALCVPHDANPRIFTCPANSQPNLKGYSPKCEYRCFRSGNFENSLDRTKYFECYFDNFLRLQSIERNCPLRTEFSTTRFRCEVPVRRLRANITETVDAIFEPNDD